MSGLDSVLNGTTSLATTEGDPIAPIRIVSEFAKKMNGRFKVKGGFMEGKVLPMADIDEIALPGKDALYSKGPRYHARTHHQPGRRSRSDPRAEGRLYRDC